MSNIKNQIQMKLREHSRYSPSALGKLMQCPEYISGPSTDDSIRGTKLHKVMETGEGYDELEDGDKDAIDRAHALVAETIKIAFPYYDKVESLEELKECKLDTGIDEVWGTLDRCIINPDQKSILAVDYKFGTQPVQPAASNFQAICYTLSLMNDYPLIDEVYFAFIMPGIPGVNAINAHLFEATDRDMLKQMVEDEVERIKNNKRLKPHYLLCSKCSKYLSCRAVKAKVRDLNRRLSITQNRTKITGNTLSDAKLVGGWVDEYLKEAKRQMVDEGLEVDGWKLSHSTPIKPKTEVTIKDIMDSGLAYDQDKLYEVALQTRQCKDIGGQEMFEHFEKLGKIKRDQRVALRSMKRL